MLPPLVFWDMNQGSLFFKEYPSDVLIKEEVTTCNIRSKCVQVEARLSPSKIYFLTFSHDNEKKRRITWLLIPLMLICVHTCVSRQLWDLYQGKTITEFTSHTAAVSVVQFHPNEYLLASGSSDRYQPFCSAPCCFVTANAEGGSSSFSSAFLFLQPSLSRGGFLTLNINVPVAMKGLLFRLDLLIIYELIWDHNSEKLFFFPLYSSAIVYCLL